MDTMTNTVAEYLARYGKMCRIRAFEEHAQNALKQKLIFGALHSSAGQEAIAVGVCANLSRSDLLFSTHRGHGHALAKGADAKAMMSELFGRASGTCGGKGGSMHIADISVGMLGANGVVAANINIAAGAAHGLKLQGSGAIVSCFFGDGAANRGPFLEGLNWTSVYQLPVLFVCEDNSYSATTLTRAVTGGAGIAARAEAFGISTVEVDGNDLAAVADAADRLVAAIRSGGGPRLLLARTYRLTGHTVADVGAYRPPGELEQKLRADPLLRCRAWLEKNGVAAAPIDAVRSAAEAEMAEAVAYATAAPWPEISSAYADVQDVGSPAERAY